MFQWLLISIGFNLSYNICLKTSHQLWNHRIFTSLWFGKDDILWCFIGNRWCFDLLKCSKYFQKVRKGPSNYEVFGPKGIVWRNADSQSLLGDEGEKATEGPTCELRLSFDLCFALKAHSKVAIKGKTTFSKDSKYV